MSDTANAGTGGSKRTIKKKANKRSSSVTFLLIGVTLFVLCVFGVTSVLAYFLFAREQRVDVAAGSYLRLDLSGPISDAPVSGGLFQEPADFPMTATDIATVVRAAAEDDRISGLYLNLESPLVGWGLAREIRTALEAFREADKPCIAYSQMYMMKDYYLASACNKVLMAPAGIAYISGIETTVMYYKDALGKVGIEPQFVHVGDYKTAVEPFERNGPSEAAIEANEALLDSIYSQVIGEIAKSRGVASEEIEAGIDSLRMSPKGVLASGLIDGLAYPETLKQKLTQHEEPGWAESLMELPAEDEDGESFIRAKKYRAEANSWDATTDGSIAVVYAEGVIMSGKGEESLFGSSGILYDQKYSAWMREARENDDVKAVVVRVNSPGGSALASDFMWREVSLTQAVGKSVVVSMGDYAASGGYMMSCNADWIVAQPTTITGSIGVFGQFFSLTETYEMLGLAEHTFKRGAHADLLSPMDKFSEGEREILQAFVGDTYDAFVGQVAEGRKREVAQVEPVAQGRVWTGEQAIASSHGLVDELGGLDVAVEKAADLAGISSYNTLKLPVQKGFFDVLLEEMSQSKVEVTLPLQLPMTSDLMREIEVMQNIEQNGRVGAYLPGWR